MTEKSNALARAQLLMLHADTIENDSIKNMVIDSATELAVLHDEIERLRLNDARYRWLRDWLDNNGLLVRAIRGESLAGYEHPDIEALRRDAERYRWLRGEHSRIDPCIQANAKYKLERQSSAWVEIHDLDAAIDAAMQEVP